MVNHTTVTYPAVGQCKVSEPVCGVLLFHNYLYSLVQSLWGKNRGVRWAAYEGGQ